MSEGIIAMIEIIGVLGFVAGFVIFCVWLAEKSEKE